MLHTFLPHFPIAPCIIYYSHLKMSTQQTGCSQRMRVTKPRKGHLCRMLLISPQRGRIITGSRDSDSSCSLCQSCAPFSYCICSSIWQILALNTHVCKYNLRETWDVLPHTFCYCDLTYVRRRLVQSVTLVPVPIDKVTACSIKFWFSFSH